MAGERVADSRVIFALDFPSVDQAAAAALAVRDGVGMVKVGLELFVEVGPRAVAIGKECGRPVFLDLKLHDIPATVAGAVRAVARMRPALLTVHAAAGQAAIAAAAQAAPDCKIVGVTVLTSLGDADLRQAGMAGPVSEAVLRLAVLAVGAGARGLVCSPQEVAAVRAEVGPQITLITPGIRAAGSDAHDQARTATATDALRAGADLLVIGRPITSAADPGAAAAALAASLRRIESVSD